MSKADLVALSATYSAVITMEDDARREHLDAMTRFLDALRAFHRTRRHRRPDAVLLLAGDQALTPAEPPACLTCGGAHRPLDASLAPPVRSRRPAAVNRHPFVA